MPIGNHLCRQLSTTWIHNVSELYAHGQKVFFRRGISLHYIYRLFLLSVPQRFGWFCTLFCTLDCKVTFLATLLATVSLSRTLQITSPVFTSIEIRKYYRSRFMGLLLWEFASLLAICNKLEVLLFAHRLWLNWSCLAGKTNIDAFVKCEFRFS